MASNSVAELICTGRVMSERELGQLSFADGLAAVPGNAFPRRDADVFELTPLT